MADNKQSGTSNRGFASMDDERQREIASQGGKAAHASGHAHEFTSEEAREAGRKGGEAVSRDREHMAEIGSEGGKSRGAHNNQHDDKDDDASHSTRGGSHEQHVEAGKQSHKNQ